MCVGTSRSIPLEKKVIERQYLHEYLIFARVALTLAPETELNCINYAFLWAPQKFCLCYS